MNRKESIKENDIAKDYLLALLQWVLLAAFIFVLFGTGLVRSFIANDSPMFLRIFWVCLLLSSFYVSCVIIEFKRRRSSKDTLIWVSIIGGVAQIIALLWHIYNGVGNSY